MTASSIETRCFVGGEYVNANDGATFPVTNPATEEHVANVASAGKHEVDAAVDAAEKAQRAWAAQPAYVRATVLRNFAGLIMQNVDLLNHLDGLAMGRPEGQYATQLDAALAAGCFNFCAGLTEAVLGDSSINTPNHLNIVIRQPYGVCAAIIPWNVPLIMFAMKVAPALGAGNALLLKPSEKAPLAAILLGRLAKDAGVPDGILSILPGAGQTGALLSSHMRIRKIAFTGSTATGRMVSAAAAHSNLKAVTLELGGKSPAIIFSDADLDVAAAACSYSITWNAGQVCIASSRLYVEAAVFDEFVAKLKANMSAIHHSDSAQGATGIIGPQADAIQSKNVLRYLEIGGKEGKIILGGRRVGTKGYFFEPTIITELDEQSKVNRDEIFGPVVVVHRFETEEEALRQANDTEYGLYASVFTKNIDRAVRVAKSLEAGSIGLNCTSPTLAADIPCGGFKGSGNGNELGKNAVLSWTEEKALFIKYGP